jgi:hypothetical protein
VSIPLRLLIAEDSQDDAILLVRELERAGYQPSYECVDNAAAMKAALEAVCRATHGRGRLLVASAGVELGRKMA